MSNADLQASEQAGMVRNQARARTHGALSRHTTYPSVVAGAVPGNAAPPTEPRSSAMEDAKSASTLLPARATWMTRPRVCAVSSSDGKARGCTPTSCQPPPSLPWRAGGCCGGGVDARLRRSTSSVGARGGSASCCAEIARRWWSGAWSTLVAAPLVSPSSPPERASPPTPAPSA